jgi:predicted nucleic acid-binding protein
MGMNLAAGIPEGSSVLIDTNPLIYQLEGNPLVSRFSPIFDAIDAGRIQAVVTPIILAEVVSGPLKSGKDELAERYKQLMTANRGWSLASIDSETAMLAARLRAKNGLKLPDAIQVAAAIRAGCYALITHDRDFKRVTDLPILGL